MRLNTIRPADGAKKDRKRVGRGIGSGSGKTCGSGHKGQKARKGGGIPLGFEGGQMPLYRRLPKFGFHSRKARYAAEVSTRMLSLLSVTDVSIDALKEAGLVKSNAKVVKIILNGDIDKAYTIKSDVKVTKGAKKAIETSGGKVEVSEAA